MANNLTEQEIQRRVDHLIKMDDVMRNLNDENLVMTWLEGGVPDEAVFQEDWDILHFMATYEDEDGSSYEETVKIYNYLLAEDAKD